MTKTNERATIDLATAVKMLRTGRTLSVIDCGEIADAIERQLSDIAKPDLGFVEGPTFLNEFTMFDGWGRRVCRVLFNDDVNDEKMRAAMKLFVNAGALRESLAVMVTTFGTHTDHCALAAIKIARDVLAKVPGYGLATMERATFTESTSRDGLIKALAVFCLDRRIRAFLELHDPMALAQAITALAEAGMTKTTPEPIDDETVEISSNGNVHTTA